MSFSTEATMMAPKSLVLVGPTNVGKSALFNRLTGTRKAIVCDRPGVTVDRHDMVALRTPVGPVRVVDTGGVGPMARAHVLGAEIERAAALAVAEADLVLLVLDGTKELSVEELEVASWLRQHQGKTPVWVVANKSDVKKHDADRFYALGFDRVFSLSAEHDLGVLDLWEAIESEWGNQELGEEVLEELKQKQNAIPRVLILGRPNAGKSTLVNTLLGSERVVVSNTPGTTRDPVEVLWEHRGAQWNLVDTGGLRQPGRLERGVEWVAREKVKDLAKNADIALLIVDSTEGVTEMDAAIAGMALDFGLSLILVFNKWDLMSEGRRVEDLRTHLERTKDLKLEFVSWCPSVELSGLTGKGLKNLAATIEKVWAARNHRVQTSSLNALFEERFRLHSHPLGPRGRPSKFYYMSQVSTNPPEFVVFANLPGSAVHFSYRRFITNTLRENFEFVGTPVQVHFKLAHDRSDRPARPAPSR